MPVNARFRSTNVDPPRAVDHGKSSSAVAASPTHQSGLRRGWSAKIHQFDPTPLHQAALKNPAVKQVMSFAVGSLSTLKQQLQLSLDQLMTPRPAPMKRLGDFSVSSWSGIDQHGGRTRSVMNHATGIAGQQIRNQKTGQDAFVSPWNASGHAFLNQRIVVDLKSSGMSLSILIPVNTCRPRIGARQMQMAAVLEWYSIIEAATTIPNMLSLRNQHRQRPPTVATHRAPRPPQILQVPIRSLLPSRCLG